MPDIHEQEGFSEAQHALLFAWISRAVMENVGERKARRQSSRDWGVKPNPWQIIHSRRIF